MDRQVELYVDLLSDEDRAVLAAEILNLVDPNRVVMDTFLKTTGAEFYAALTGALERHFTDGTDPHSGG